uniref:Uncharacterized protein n=1 Tax=Arundo donax TaxID=35708 RepID=A0A0A8ZPJ1_ARUDO
METRSGQGGAGEMSCGRAGLLLRQPCGPDGAMRFVGSEVCAAEV